jgi:hypothetical protein
MAGSPEIELPKGQQLADAAKGRRPAAKSALIVRGQSPSEDPFLNEPAVAMLETAKAQAQTDGRTSLTAPPLRSARQEHQVTSDAGEFARAREGDRGNARWSVDEAPSRKATAADSPPAKAKQVRTLPRKSPQDVAVAETRSSAMPRQATEWSEFPPDPRPSPLILRGQGNHSRSAK